MVSLVDLFDPAGFYPLCVSLISSLDGVSILRLSMTCRALRRLYDSAKKIRWNIDKSLVRFVKDPSFFRLCMQQTGTIISGSFALQFFDGVYWPESDLNMYVPGSSRFEVLTRCLIDNEGYHEEKYPSVNWPEMGSLYNLRSFTRGDKRIQLIIVVEDHDDPVRFILGNFYGSAILNFITFSKAYSVFPENTFIQRDMCILKDRTLSREREITKYRRRGFEPTELRYSTVDATKIAVSERLIGDSQTWCLDLGNPWRLPENKKFTSLRISIRTGIGRYLLWVF
ncbi:hypothetical protein LOZ65_003594 [Ophidiomyces ophidiicola]|nr:hypothetical protein LOZ65_003594 [Ophidiomyces ophidiicola]